MGSFLASSTGSSKMMELCDICWLDRYKIGGYIKLGITVFHLQDTRACRHDLNMKLDSLERDHKDGWLGWMVLGQQMRQIIFEILF